MMNAEKRNMVEVEGVAVWLLLAYAKQEYGLNPRKESLEGVLTATPEERLKMHEVIKMRALKGEDKDFIDDIINEYFEEPNRLERLEMILIDLKDGITPDNASLLLKGYEILMSICKDENYHCQYCKDFTGDYMVRSFFGELNCDSDRIKMYPVIVPENFQQGIVDHITDRKINISDRVFVTEDAINMAIRSWRALAKEKHTGEVSAMETLQNTLKITKYEYVFNCMYSYLQWAHDSIAERASATEEVENV